MSRQKETKLWVDPFTAFFWPGRREMWGQWPEDGGLKSEVGEGGGRRSCLIGGTAI